MGSIGERIRLGVRDAMSSILLFLFWLVCALAWDTRREQILASRNPTQIFSFMPDASVIVVSVALSLMVLPALP